MRRISRPRNAAPTCPTAGLSQPKRLAEPRQRVFIGTTRAIIRAPLRFGPLGLGLTDARAFWNRDGQFASRFLGGLPPGALREILLLSNAAFFFSAPVFASRSLISPSCAAMYSRAYAILARTLSAPAVLLGISEKGCRSLSCAVVHALYSIRKKRGAPKGPKTTPKNEIREIKTRPAAGFS